MVTKRKHLVPIFEYPILIIIFDDWEELKSYIPKDVYDVEVFVENNQEVISVSMQRIDLNMFVD